MNPAEVCDQFVLTPARLDDPAAAELIEAVQGEYVTRYGGRDDTPVCVAEFHPPRGMFLIGRVDGLAVACGGWRGVDAGTGEIKRMYVAPAARGRGLSRLVLAELEATARAAGLGYLRLETGDRQPEAIALYASSGYRPVEKFGHYRCDPASVCFGKQLR